MIKPLLLKFHRWTSLVFALPLLAILASGLILSFEPMSQVSGMSRPVDAARVADLIQRYDPDGKARGLFINAAAQHLTLQGAPTPDIDLVTGEAAPAQSALAGVFLWARFTHERLLGLPWLVTASTIAMVVIMSLGIAMGLPRLRNTLSGWHKGAAWFTLPLILLSPLTGLCMAFGLTFQSGSAPANAARPKTLVEAVNVVAKTHDLSHVVSINVRGGRMMARIYEGGELRAYAVNADGLTALPRNWPRLLHEGNWSAMIGSPANILISVVLLGLLITGIWLWGRRTLARRQRRGQDRDRAVPIRSAA
jgi:PepSY-associated TM region